MFQVLYFLSKTDRSIIPHCSPNARNVQASLGFFVLMTGLFACMSGTFAISNMFIHENMDTGLPETSLGGRVGSILIGCLYGAFIMAIDREIVSASNKWAAVFRIPMAIMISIVIAVPAELQLFESRVNHKLESEGQTKNEELRNRLENRHAVPQLKAEIQKLKDQRLQDIARRNEQADIMHKEVVGILDPSNTSGKAGKGPAYEEAQRNKEMFEASISEEDDQIRIKEAELRNAGVEQNTDFKVEKRPQSYDLLSHYIALHELISDDKTGSANQMSWGITLLFLLFELVPALIKIFQPKTEYDALLDKRTRLNIYATRAIFEQSHIEYDSMSVDQIRQENRVVVQQMYGSQAF